MPPPDVPDVSPVVPPPDTFGSETPEPEIPTVPPMEPLFPLPDNPTVPASWRTPEFNLQHGLGLIGVEHRYAKGFTGEGTLGAIYDTGIELTHGDVGGIRLDLSHSYVGTEPNDLTDTNGHGTAVYGVAGARRNGVDIHGVAWGADFMILKQAESDFTQSFADVLEGVIAADVDVVNNSWASSIKSGQLSPVGILAFLGPDLVAQLRRTAWSGVSIVFATGNEGSDQSHYLAGLSVVLPELNDNWVAVMALGNVSNLDMVWKAAYADSCGDAMNWCLAAPGTAVKSLRLGGGTRKLSGTSMAAPHVTGAILILKSQFDELTTKEIHQILFDTAVDIDVPGVDRVFGHGALNLNEALLPQGDMMVELGARGLIR